MASVEKELPVMAMITGSGNGIGQSLAIHCANNDINLLLLDINNKALNKTKQQILGSNNNIKVIICTVDVSDYNTLQETILLLIKSEKLPTNYNIKYLFNCAGIFDVLASFTNPSAYNRLHKTFNINFWGYVNTIQCFLPYLNKNNILSCSWIINISSITGISSGIDIYGVSKSAVCSYSEALYRELRKSKKNIKVMVVCPSAVDTNIVNNTRNMLLHGNQSELYTQITNKEQQKRLDYVKTFLKKGSSTGKICKLIFDGIKNNKFYVHSDLLDVFAASKAKFNSIITGDFEESSTKKTEQIRKQIEMEVKAKL
eukprot:441943_1